MAELIPPIWFDLIRIKTVILRDENSSLGAVFGLDFRGDHVQASLFQHPTGKFRGTVVVKNENPIGPDAPLPAYFSGHGTFSVPVHSGTTQVTLIEDDSNNMTLINSDTDIQVDVTGLYFAQANLVGATTSDICLEHVPPFSPATDHFENKYFTVALGFSRYTTFQTFIEARGDSYMPGYENCHLGGNLVSSVTGLFLASSTNFIRPTLILRPFGFASPAPYHAPSFAGEYFIDIQRVSLGS